MPPPETNAASDAPRSVRLAQLVFVLTALWAAWCLGRGWNASILDRHEGRQVQTALTAQCIRDDGVALAYPLPVFGPPWSAPMEFPLYQALVGWTARWTGAPVDQAGRGVSVLFFAAMLPGAWGLLGLAGLGRAGRWIALSALLSSPVLLFYSRTVLIESTALGLAVWFLYALVRGTRDGGWRWPLAAAALGALAATVKVTTVLPFGLVGAAVVLRGAWGVPVAARAEKTRRLLVAAAGPAVVVLGAAWLWVRFGDAVKLSNPFSVFLTSTELAGWNFGTLAQRLSAPFWNQLHATTTHGVLAEGGLWLGVVAFALADARARRLALLAVAAFFAGPLVFANLYFVHDYYFYAAAPWLVGALGVLLASVWERAGTARWAAPALVLAALGAQAVEYGRGYAALQRNPPPAPPEIAAVVAAVVPLEGVVFVGGWDWNATLAYYAERRALMPRGHEDDLAAIERVAVSAGLERIGAAVWRGPAEPPAALRDWWREKLGLIPAPAVRDGDLRLYVRPAGLAKLPGVFAPGRFHSAKLELWLAARPWDAELKEMPWQDDGLPGPAVPAPYKTRSFHGCGVYQTGGERRIIAHAVTELFIRPPAGARRIVAEFRMLPEAYERANPGDGADVDVFEDIGSGARRRLFHRRLQPATVPADRGEQSVELTNFGPLVGDLVFAVTPGPAGRADFDWCDWKRIAVE